MTSSIPTVLKTLHQEPVIGELVTLYIVDASMIPGGAVYHFTEARYADGSSVVWNGISFVPVDIEVSGFEVTSNGQMPTPRIKVGAANMIINALAWSAKDGLGAVFQRIRTYRQFLDGQSLADPTAIIGPEVFRVERKANHNKNFIEFELSTVLDQQGRQLPNRQVLRDVCTKRYRLWNGTSFTYPQADPCPYTGVANYDVNNDPTTAANDACSKQLTGCKLRFAGQPLPFGGFPGVGRFHA